MGSNPPWLAAPSHYSSHYRRSPSSNQPTNRFMSRYVYYIAFLFRTFCPGFAWLGGWKCMQEVNWGENFCDLEERFSFRLIKWMDADDHGIIFKFRNIRDWLERWERRESGLKIPLGSLTISSFLPDPAVAGVYYACMYVHVYNMYRGWISWDAPCARKRVILSPTYLCALMYLQWNN